ELTQNPDILTWMGEHKGYRFVTGFALEDTENITEARRKLTSKQADMIVLNTALALDADENKITLVGEDFEESLPPMSKTTAARMIVDKISRSINKRVR
nr:bifunctional 4'-phosphopantothenoylcysteine decarboxylase/phosphopantothenoylcysteine synthetase [FCB group bacterium]